MSGVLIIQDHFNEANRLATILGDRLAKVETLSMDQLKAHKPAAGCRLVASTAFVEGIGGGTATTTPARGNQRCRSQGPARHRGLGDAR